MTLYDKIGYGYDTTRKADAYIINRLLYHMKPEGRGKYIDIACGSGNYTIALKASGLDVCGLDISDKMLRLAQQKDSSIDWVMGDAGALPFSEDSFYGAFCVLALHHFKDLQQVLLESSNVVANRMVIFTATAEQIENYWLNEYFPAAMRKSIEQMPSSKTITETLLKSGFKRISWEPYEIQDTLQDFFLYVGKKRPEMYLDAKVRLGSSTFSSLASPEEVTEGCDLLEADIRSGRIHRVMQAYNSNIGDYVFVTGIK